MTAMLAAGGGRELWYLTRATGVVTLLLLTGTVALGIATTGSWERLHWPRFVTQGLHRNISLLSVLFLAMHVGTTVVDGYVPIGWANAVVPFTSPYRRLWLGLGAVACDLILAVVLTSMVRRRLRPGTWRGVHWLAYASWPVALLHGIGTGTDATDSVLRISVAGSLLLVAATVTWRLAHHFPAGRSVRAAGGLALVLTMAGAVFGLDGGLRPHVAPTLVRATPAPPLERPTGTPTAPTTPPPATPTDSTTPPASDTSSPDAQPAGALAFAVPAVERLTELPGDDLPATDAPSTTTTTTTTPAPTGSPAPPPTTTTTTPSPTTTTTTTAPPSTTTTTAPKHCPWCGCGLCGEGNR